MREKSYKAVVVPGSGLWAETGTTAQNAAAMSINTLFMAPLLQ